MKDLRHDAAAAPGGGHPDAGPSGEWVHAHPSKIARIGRRLIALRAGAALADTFKVLGDLTRVRILDALARAELCVCDLAALLHLTESAVSHQLRLLRSMRVVRSRRAGRMVFYSLDDEHVMALFEQGLRHIEEATPAAAARPPWVAAPSPARTTPRPLGGDRAPGSRRVPRTEAGR